MSWTVLSPLATGACLAVHGANLKYRRDRGIRYLVGGAFWLPGDCSGSVKG